MAAENVIPREEVKQINERIELARQERQPFVSTVNNYLQLTKPMRTRLAVGGPRDTARDPDEQDDLFDTTLQDVADDFASDMNDHFTPGYKPWTKHVPTADVESMSTSAKERVKRYVQARMTKTYDAIKRSNFEEASQEFWFDLSIAWSGFEIAYTPAGRPVSVQNIPVDELLIRPGPRGGVDDRWWERTVLVRHLDELWPQLDWSDFGATPEERARSKNRATVICGGFRDWTKAEETWNWHVIAKGKVLRRRVYTGAGSCPFVVGRTSNASPGAYGVGPGNKAIAAARTLNELAFLFLKRHGRDLDPPVIFFDDGLLNPEGGIENGTWLPASETFKVQELRPDGSAREVWFSQEDLRMIIRRALFQDKPFQRGDTPPTAAQWLSEESMAERRMSFPRARIHDEVVLPVLRRFEWILEKRGEIEPLKVEGALVNVEPVSPLSRSADIEEAQVALQFLQAMGGSLPEELARIDGVKTMAGIRDKMGADLVHLLDDEAYAAKLQQQQAIAAMGGQQ